MKVHRKRAVRLAILGMVLALAGVGCGKSEESSSASSSAAPTSAESSAPTSAATSSPAEAAAEEGGLTALLMKPGDIPPTEAGAFVGEEPKVEETPGNPPNVSQFYKSGDNQIQSVVFVAADEAAAANAVQTTMADPGLSSEISGTAEPAPNVAEDAWVLSGPAVDGSASMAVLMFSEGTAVAQLTFGGKPDNPVPPDFLDSVGVIQLEAIKQGLPNLGE